MKSPMSRTVLRQQVTMVMSCCFLLFFLFDADSVQQEAFLDSSLEVCSTSFLGEAFYMATYKYTTKLDSRVPLNGAVVLLPTVQYGNL